MIKQTSSEKDHKTPFVQHIQEQVQGYQEAYSLSAGKAFMLWYGIEALSLSEDEAYEAASYDGGNDKSIDLFYVDDENERIVIAQGKFNAQCRYAPSVGEYLALVHATDWLQYPEDLHREGRPDLADAATDYKEALIKGYAVDFHFVYMGPSHRDVVASSTKFNSANIKAVPVRTSRVVDAIGLQQLHDEYIDASTRIGNATVNLHTEETFEQQGAYGKSLTATIAGEELQKLYAEHGDRLFDRNVRVYLGARTGSVNAGIQDTLNSNDRRNFWAYNNGITFICDRYEFDAIKGNLEIHNFSIVNGCQTTVSVARASKTAASEVEILVRFIAPSSDQVVDSIIRYTNSQTPIRLWDFASQDTVQKRLKREFAEEPNPFFYELRRGERGHLSAQERRTFNRGGKFHVITPDVLAQYLAAFRGLPVEAYRYKASLFTTHRETVFPSDLRIEEAIVAWLAGDAAEQVVKTAIADSKQFEDPHRSLILRRGAKLFTLAVMGTILTERNGEMYLVRVARSSASSTANRQRLSRYSTVALEWYIEAMQDLIAGGADLNSLIRSQDTFSRIRSKVKSRWRVQSLSTQWVDDVLPRI